MNIRFLMTCITPLAGLVVGLQAAKTLHTMHALLGAFLGFAVGVAVIVAFSIALDRLIMSFGLLTDRPTLTQQFMGCAGLMLLIIAPLVAGVGAHFAVAAL
jgi:hypothetical protein